MISFDECVEKGLLRKVPPSHESARQHMEKAGQLLEEASADLKAGHFNSAAIVGYIAALNAANALLARDGFREKSHACVARYLEAKRGREVGLDLIAVFDAVRDSRHDIQYSATFLATKKEAGEIVAFAERFVARIRLLF